PSRVGCVWHWHPECNQWLVNCRAYPTEGKATAGLEESLAHEQGGDLDKQHKAPGCGPARSQLDSDGLYSRRSAMQVRDVMTKGCECIPPDSSLQQAAQKMRDLDIGPLPVCEDSHLVGM